MDARLVTMARERTSQESLAKEKQIRNDALKQRLLELKKGQERLADRLERVRAEKTRLTSHLEERTAKCLHTREEAEKLQPYVLQSSASLQTSLTDLSDSLSRDRNQIDALEKRHRALQTSADSFTLAGQDVGSCSKILEEIVSEMQRADEENAKAARRKDMLSERSHNVREVEHTEGILQKQLARWLERTEAVRKGSREKASSAKVRMEDLRKEHKALSEERATRGREMEKKKVNIEQTEKKVSLLWPIVSMQMPISCFLRPFPRNCSHIHCWLIKVFDQMADLKENIENEIHTAHEEFLKIDSHINLYITEMEQSIR